MALLISGALTVGNAACLLPDVPTWYSASLVTLTLVGLFWVIAATLSAQRDAAVADRQERAAGRLRDSTSAAPANPRGGAPAARCEQPRRETPRGQLHALPGPTDPDGPARPSLGRTRPRRPHLSVVTATLVRDPDAPATPRQVPPPAAAPTRPSSAAVVTDLPALSAAQRIRGAQDVVTRADLNVATPIGTHPQALYVARDIATYSEPARVRRARFARVQARATLVAAWRARLAAAYDGEPAPPTRLRDTRA